MSSTTPDYLTVITNIGIQKFQNATVTGQGPVLSQVGVGDGNTYPTPSITALNHENVRLPVTSVNYIEAQQLVRCVLIIPPDVGGWFIREIGIFDTAGDLILVANYPEVYKPDLNSPVAFSITVTFDFKVVNAETVQVSYTASNTVTVSTVTSLIDTHNKSANSHADIRSNISNLQSSVSTNTASINTLKTTVTQIGKDLDTAEAGLSTVTNKVNGMGVAKAATNAVPSTGKAGFVFPDGVTIKQSAEGMLTGVKITYGTVELIPGVSPLETGAIHIVVPPTT